MLEYRANYEEEPDYFSSVAELVSFMDKNDILLHLTEKEAEVLLCYMSGHDLILDKKEDRLFRGDLCYEINKIRWIEYSIDDVIDVVCEWNYDLLIEAEEQIGNTEGLINQKNDVNSLRADEQILDALFDHTRYGKEINELAEKLAEDNWKGEVNDWR